MTITRTVAGRQITFDVADVRRVLIGIDPEAIREHYVVVDGRRYPPKQVLSVLTGLDRADFTTHQARRILQRAGLSVGRAGRLPSTPPHQDRSDWPYQGREADVLRPHMGKWVAYRPLEVVFAADSPEEVVAWINRTGTRVTSIFGVPDALEDTESWMWR